MLTASSRLIWSIGEVERFVNLLPEIEEEHAYLLMLIVRSKYAKQILGKKMKDVVIEHEFVLWHEENWRRELIRRVVKLAVLAEHAEHIYVIRRGGEEVQVHPEACGIMILLNQASIRHGLYELLKIISEDVLLRRTLTYISDIPDLYFSVLHRCSKSRFHVIDVDVKVRELLDELLAHLDKYRQPFLIIETRNGWHVVLDMRRFEDNYDFAQKFFTNFVNNELKVLAEKYRKYVNTMRTIIEYRRDAIEPIPGTVYGGFNVRLITAPDLV